MVPYKPIVYVIKVIKLVLIRCVQLKMGAFTKRYLFFNKIKINKTKFLIVSVSFAYIYEDFIDK